MLLADVMEKADRSLRPGPGAIGVLQSLVGAAMLAAMAIGFAISFAALVYNGPLASLLANGIALTLSGGAVMAVVGGLSFSFRGTICAPQDVTALLLGLAAGAMFAQSNLGPQAFLPTLVALTVVSTLSAGLASLAMGRLRLARLVRFVPYTVIGGFLAATGYLLVLAGVGIVLREPVDLWTLGVIFRDGAPAFWGPWIAGAFAMVLLTRRWDSDLALPLVPVLGAVAFYGWISVSGLGLDGAARAGLLLGPFPEGGFLVALTAGVAGPVEWGLILGQTPAILAITGLTLLGGLLNSTGLELTLGKHVDFDRDMAANGSANIAAALTGGLPGYSILAETVLAHKLGLRGAMPALIVATSLLAALVFGAGALSYLPAGLIAMLVAFLGFDLLYTWLVRERARLLAHEHGVILLILAVAATIGFLEAVAVGFAAAFVIFVISYGRTDPVRLRATAETRVSRIERSEADAAALAAAGARTVILDLSGHLFFGSANRVLERVRAERQDRPAPARIVVNFDRVDGIDASAAQSLMRVVLECREHGVRPIFCGLRGSCEAQYVRAAAPDALADRYPSLDAALESIEAEELALADTAGTDESDLIAAARNLVAEGWAEEMAFVAGETLLELGAASDEIYVLTEGACRAEVPGRDGQRYLVARFLPGALIGEIASYTGSPRTAWVVADQAGRAIRIHATALPDTGGTAARFHRAAARSLSRRVRRMTRLVQDADI